MGIRVAVMADTRDEADGCVVMLRAMGMEVGSPTHLSHNDSWMVRALPAGQRHLVRATPQPTTADEPTG